MTLVSTLFMREYETISAIWLLFLNRQADETYVWWGHYFNIFIPLQLNDLNRQFKTAVLEKAG